MNAFLYHAAVLAAEEEENDLKGLFQGSQSVLGIILIVVGLLTVWLGIKLWQGYKLIPSPETAVPLEDNYVPIKAKVLQKKKSTMPSPDGSEPRVLIQWKIGYQVDEEKYTQIVGDGDYEKGDFIDIKYDPEDPRRFYVDDGPAVSEAEREPEEQADEKNKNGLIVAALGMIVGVIGIMLLL